MIFKRRSCFYNSLCPSVRVSVLRSLSLSLLASTSIMEVCTTKYMWEMFVYVLDKSFVFVSNVVLAYQGFFCHMLIWSLEVSKMYNIRNVIYVFSPSYVFFYSFCLKCRFSYQRIKELRFSFFI